jgi:hypothetical protein
MVSSQEGLTDDFIVPTTGVVAHIIHFNDETSKTQMVVFSSAEDTHRQWSWSWDRTARAAKRAHWGYIWYVAAQFEIRIIDSSPVKENSSESIYRILNV